ncbi:MAG: carbon-nitrogen hydrolase [Anaerolineales bacterium]|nr:carbon-nitrogen hydrolase [Chloroflexota bacterium]MBL6980068.1 carbon-nitrogen hydrolase [Anaerolineales bacterium]
MTCSDDVQANFEKTLGYIEQAASEGAQIICTQELFKSLYFCQSEDFAHYDLAEDVSQDGSTVQTLSQLAKELRVVLIASLFEKRALGLYHNTTVVIDADGGYLGKYRKMHIPDDPHYYEKFYFTPGDLGYKVFHTQYADIGVLICWDQWYPEAARLLGLQGAEIIFIPTAIGYSMPEEGSTYDQSWQIVQRGHAVANACYLAAVNRVGFEVDPSTSLRASPSIALPASDDHMSGVGPNGESGINFWGQSFVADPDGSIVKQASRDRDELVICPVDLALIEETKKLYSFPYRDRRVDSYGDLLKLYSD